MGGYPEGQQSGTQWVLWTISPTISCPTGLVRLWSKALQVLIFSILLALLGASNVSLDSSRALAG